MEQEQFENIWTEIIKRKCDEYCASYGGLIYHEEVKNEIWFCYDELYSYVKHHYMLPYEDGSEPQLNHYKVAAVFMIAILRTRPLKKVDPAFYKHTPDRWAFNEGLALHVGLNILWNSFRYYLQNIKERPEGYDWNLIDKVFPADQKIFLTGEKREKWESELYFLRQEACYHLLSFEHELEDYVENLLLRERLHQMRAQSNT